MPIAALQIGSTRIVYKPEVLPAVSAEWLQPSFWAMRGAINERFGGRGQALGVTTSAGPAVLRRFWRGGLVARLVTDRYLFIGYRRSRALAEFAVLERLHGQGLPVPEPLLASCERTGLVYRAGLLTRRIDGAVTLAEIGGRLAPEQWRDLGQVLNRFFHAGVHHPDLNAHNILLDRAQSWVLVDFDRARLLDRPVDRRSMLARLLRSLNKLGISAHRHLVSEAAEDSGEAVG